MRNYDFETLVDRRGCGAIKWDNMLKDCPDVGEDVIPFTIADMELRNAPEIVEGLKNYLDRQILGYTQPTQSYHAAVCDWMRRRHGWQVEPEQLVFFPGVVPALYGILGSLGDKGDGVLLMTPVYPPFYAAIEENGMQIVRCPLAYENGAYSIDFDDFEQKAKRPDVKFLLLCSPHNPVGRVWSRAELTRIGRICIDNGVFVISDEIHFDLILPGYTHTVFASISEEFSRYSITCTAPSKTFNLAGMQLSNIVAADPEVRERVRPLHENLNALGYHACELAYSRAESWLDALLLHIERNRRLVEEFVRENLPDVGIVRLEGTYLQWLDFRGLGLGASALEHFMVHKARLFLDEGYIFGAEGEGFERVNLACPTRVLRAALARLKQAVDNR